MQELRSTDILDKEIKADAIRKAENILKKADFESQQILDSVKRKIENAKQEKQDFYSKKLKAKQDDLDAALPLEKQRIEVLFIQSSIIEAINNYLKNLSQEKRLEIVTKKFEFPADKKFNAFVYGFDLDFVNNFLSKKLGKNLICCEKTEFGKIVEENDIGLAKNEGIILEAQDKSLRCRLTLVEAFSRILDTYRKDLVQTLFPDGGAK